MANAQVYSASQHVQSAGDAPSSVTVATREEIRAYGYRTAATRSRSALPFFRVVLSLLCLVAALRGNVHGQMDEYSIKAGYLYNFSKYVEWPEGSFAASDSPFLICLLGDDPFGQRLDQAIAGKVSGDGRALQVKRLKDPDRAALRNCRIVFLSKSEKADAAAIMEWLKDTSIFSVADFDSFAEQGGIADLRIEGTRVKVDLNVNAANHANLKISAQLQQVANLVR